MLDINELLVATDTLAPALLALVADGHGIVRGVSRTLRELTGFDADELIGHGYHRLSALLVLPARLSDLVTRLRNDGEWQGTVDVRSRLGRECRVEFSVLRVPVSGSTAPLYAAFGQEVVPAEPAMRANRLRMLGQIGAGLLHDLNNVISALLGHSELARLHAQAGRIAKLDHSLGEIQTAGEMSLGLTNSLLDLVRERPMSTQAATPLTPSVQMIARLLRPTLPSSVEMRISLDESAVIADSNAVAVQQCVLNLAVNAREVLGHGGTITLVTRGAALVQSMCAACNRRVDGRWVSLSCHDDGPGIAPEMSTRLFQAFATTRGRAGGSGLGLAVVSELVHRAGGHITIESAVGKGAHIRLLYEPAT